MLCSCDAIRKIYTTLFVDFVINPFAREGVGVESMSVRLLAFVFALVFIV